jgi:magnesium transporter
VLKVLCHSEQSGWTEIADISSVSDLRADPDSLVWAELNITDLTPADLSTISDEFDLDGLAVEDSVNPRQRPKIERYDTHLFAVLHQLDEVEEQLEQRQIATFMGDSYVLIIHEDAERTLIEARKRLEENADQITSPAYMLHALMDVVVDDYEAIADQLEVDIEQLEEQALAASGREMSAQGKVTRLPDQREIYRVKQQVSRLKRFGLPLSRVLERITTRQDTRVDDADSRKLFRDVYDHLLRFQGQVTNIDDLTNAVLDLTRGELADTLNEINKKLTAWAAIIAAPTLITGFYGMNVMLFPHAGTSSGLIVAVALMVVSVAALYWNFKTRDWI